MASGNGLNGLDVVIAGAGIGGLTAALALLRSGQCVQVFERASAPGEAGAGLTITPNGSRVLEALGLGDWIRERANLPVTGVIRRGTSGEILAWNTRRDDVERSFGAPYFQVHRADLHAELIARVHALDAGAIRTGDAFLGLEQDGDALRARFHRSGWIAAGALIGADGVRSAVRDALFGGPGPVFTGYVAHRGLVAAGALPAGLIDHPSCLYIAPGRMFLRYPVRGGELVNFVSIGHFAAWTEESWSVPAPRSELLAALDGWHPDVRTIVERTPEENLFKWGLFDRTPLTSWSAGRATLLGDAAHPMLPFLGQGAVMAIEDAAVLGRAITGSAGVTEALACYEAARIPRANRVMQLSKDNGARLLSRHGEACAPGQLATARSLGLMDYDPLTAPIPGSLRNPQ